MNEKDKTDQVKINNDVADSESSSEMESIGPFESIEAMFAMFQEQADREHVSVDHAVSSVAFALKTADEIKQYFFRINPALTDNGRLSVASLDLYRVELDFSAEDKENQERLTHLQQWIVRASWINGKPKITDGDIDASIIQANGNIISLFAVAEHARRVLEHRIAIKKITAEYGTVMPVMPPARGVN